MLPPWNNIYFTIPGLYTDYSPPILSQATNSPQFMSQTQTNTSKTEGGADQTGLFRLERARDSISRLSKVPNLVYKLWKHRGQPGADRLPPCQYQNPAITTVAILPQGDLRLTSTCWHGKQNLSNHKHKKWGQQEAATLLTTSCANNLYAQSTLSHKSWQYFAITTIQNTQVPQMQWIIIYIYVNHTHTHTLTCAHAHWHTHTHMRTPPPTPHHWISVILEKGEVLSTHPKEETDWQNLSSASFGSVPELLTNVTDGTVTGTVTVPLTVKNRMHSMAVCGRMKLPSRCVDLE